MGQANGPSYCVESAMSKKRLPPLATTDELAARWNVTSGHLKNLRSLGGGPKFVRVAKRGIRYRREVIEAWERAK